MTDQTNIDSQVGKEVTVNKTINIDSDPSKELLDPTWMNQWKEILAYIFGAIIAFDFIIAPILVMFFDVYSKSNLFPVWTPLTLQGGGLFYVAMGAILSVAGYGSFVQSRELIKNLPTSK